MGQYYKIVNIDKKEYINPHDFGDGAKLMSFALSSMGVMSGLAILLADGNGNGGGDLYTDGLDQFNWDIVGRWAGDRIVIAGDYAENGSHVQKDHVKGIVDTDGHKVSEHTINLYTLASVSYENISGKVLFTLMSDKCVRDEMVKMADEALLQKDKQNMVYDFKVIHETLLENKSNICIAMGSVSSKEAKAIINHIFKNYQEV